ncbi:MAG: ribosome small subunit-dependent GTPase A [Planctomycetota bacterium]
MPSREKQSKAISILSDSDQKKALEQLGFDSWFRDQSQSCLKKDTIVARVTEVHKKTYTVCTGQHHRTASLAGRFAFHSKSKTDYPTVGDWVTIQLIKHGTMARIGAVIGRKSLLKRKEPGKKVKFQLIAANIDVAFVIQSVDSNFDINRLERYLVMIHDSDIRPVVVFSKTDLISADQLSEILKQIKRFSDQALFLPISCVTGEGIGDLQNELKAGQTYCLLGSSGVGKTTLLNTLLGEHLFDVSEVREKNSKGMHTTTKRQLIRLPSGPIFIDTPGMRELANFAIDGGLDETFDDIFVLSGQCHFNNCTHTHENNCAVIAAVEQGLVDQDRYQNFIKIQTEATSYETSYVENQRKRKFPRKK